MTDEPLDEEYEARLKPLTAELQARLGLLLSYEKPSVGQFAAIKAVEALCDIWAALIDDGGLLPDDRMVTHINETIEVLQKLTERLSRPTLKLLPR